MRFALSAGLSSSVAPCVPSRSEYRGIKSAPRTKTDVTQGTNVRSHTLSGTAAKLFQQVEGFWQGCLIAVQPFIHIRCGWTYRIKLVQVLYIANSLRLRRKDLVRAGDINSASACR